MKFVFFNVDFLKLFITDLYPLFINIFINGGLYF